MRSAWPLTARGTGALALALVFFVSAGQLGIGELVYFGLLLLGALVAAVISLHVGRRAETVVRTLSTEVGGVGRTSTVTVRIGMRTAVPSPPGRWSDTLPPTLDGDASGVFPALGSALRGDEHTIVITYPVTGVRRGVQPIGPLQIISTDPFGLARRRHVLGARTTVTVVPALIDLPSITNYAGAVGGILHTTTDHLGQGADNLIARPYVPGDSMRRIHWRASAHLDALMVRQEEQESTPEATVLLDRSVLRYAAEASRAPGADPGFEAAVSMCVSAAARLAREGYAVEVIDCDGTPLADALEGGEIGEVDRMLATFATIVAHRDDHLMQLPRLFAGVVTGPLVLVTGRFDPADAGLIAPLAAHSTMPILFAAAPVGDALDLAAEAGWHCAAIDPDADIAAAWGALLDRGVTSVLPG